MPEAGRLGWVIVYVRDVEQALDFYERAFGLTRSFVDESGQYGQLETGPTTLAFADGTLAESNFKGGVALPTPDGPLFNVELCLVFDDVAAAYDLAVQTGCTGLASPIRKPWGQEVAFVRDPFGTLVELASPLP